MRDTKELLERARRQFPPPGDVMDALVRRRDRKRRNRRIGSAVVAVVMVVAVAVGLGLAFGIGKGTPANNPSPTPTVVGSTTTGAVVIGLDGTLRSAVPTVPSYANSLVMSPDGRTVAFSNGARVATIGIDGTQMRFLTRLFSRDTGAGSANVSFLSWSPDGSRIAFVVDRGFGRQIMLVNADGSHLTRLTFDQQQDEWPSWSPDGSTIVYANSGTTPLDGSDGSPTEEIWTIPAGGGPPTRLTRNHVLDSAPVYSPDGTRIAFKHDTAIWIMDSDGGNAHPLPGQPCCHNFAPRWSPDGSRIALLTYYTKQRGPGDSPLLTIHVVEVATGTATRIPGLVQTVLNPVSWLPSGDALLVNRYSG